MSGTKAELESKVGVYAKQVKELETSLEDYQYMPDWKSEMAARDNLLLRIADAFDDITDDGRMMSRWSDFSREIKDLLGVGDISLGELLGHPEEPA